VVGDHCPPLRFSVSEDDATLWWGIEFPKSGLNPLVSNGGGWLPR
jgi:hypothetical protein